ncbi:MAG: DUF4760 domain-containing protein [Rhizomicrobium sp.]
MGFFWHEIMTIPAPTSALIAITFATLGWLYTARRSRAISRKQHTFNALLQSSFNEKYHENLNVIRPFLRKGEFPDLSANQTDPAIVLVRESLRFILNHYEFIAAGIRNGDVSEKLLKDTERGTIIRIFEVAHKYVAAQRDSLRRSTFEHIEWLFIRWKEAPPTRWQRFVEWVIARPLYYDAQKWIALAILIGVLSLIFIAYLHLPGELFNPLSAKS